jgi:hypothetical protein
MDGIRPEEWVAVRRPERYMGWESDRGNFLWQFGKVYSIAILT